MFNDFGFTAVTEEELEAVQQVKAEAESTTLSTQEKLDNLYKAIQPLLDNLRANPDKAYIHWPNRVDKVDQFQIYLDKIYYGE